MTIKKKVSNDKFIVFSMGDCDMSRCKTKDTPKTILDILTSSDWEETRAQFFTDIKNAEEYAKEELDCSNNKMAIVKINFEYAKTFSNGIQISDIIGLI